MTAVGAGFFGYSRIASLARRSICSFRTLHIDPAKVTQNTQLQAHLFQLPISPDLARCNNASGAEITQDLQIRRDSNFATLSTSDSNFATHPARLRSSINPQATQMEARENERPTTKISRLTIRNASLETSLDDCLEKCHQQMQSILYRDLPKEIRDMIFEYATAQYEDMDRKYKETAFWCRPGHGVSHVPFKLHCHILSKLYPRAQVSFETFIDYGPHKTCTNLLLTCRRIWLEANALPMKQAVFTFWMRPTRGPPEKHPDTGGYGRDPIRNNTLTKLNRESLTTLHYFLQMFVAESMFFPNNEETSLIQRLKPKVLRITIRHTDWWYWEGDEPLRLKDSWVQRALDAPFMASVNDISLELETLERKKSQLQVIVDRLTKMKGRASLNDGMVTRFEMSGEPHVWHWTGPSNIDGQEYEPYKGLKTLDYRVVTLKWKRVPIREKDVQDVLEGLSTNATAARPTGQQRWRDGWNARIARLRLAGVGRCSQNSVTLAEYLMRKESMERALKTQRQMESRFRKMFAEIEARNFEERWQERMRYRDDDDASRLGIRVLRLHVRMHEHSHLRIDESMRSHQESFNSAQDYYCDATTTALF
ncbi:uncharacterized protein MYCFIDRAFT_173162 [Pseudocercospora fijiensis CIRAD86]|uniref:Uncharacterized protein n=1 Tax=Pseudocercospora fijiensis (strain CIRAD86) TaxID=383855 RepID=M2ZYU0_PSEFD|nr:uncharacterized protein MYCFIDRAFT_173162 [Pseudocercospora fijiensis CIRAD86]EME84114.1 hypothetical protein MYCFIDRAFT_173162 [Pseudocercospora fijiensis CIRAD86]